jgi:uncharacterized membrane protein
MTLSGFLLYPMSLLYVAAGINHFVHPRVYLKIMPACIPHHGAMVAVSGVAEIVLGLLLLPAVTRVAAAWLIIGLLVAVFPANIQMAADYSRQDHPQLWIALLRLPLQGVLLYWAWLYTHK